MKINGGNENKMVGTKWSGYRNKNENRIQQQMEIIWDMQWEIKFGYQNGE